jgi:hypothetical protein
MKVLVLKLNYNSVQLQGENTNLFWGIAMPDSYIEPVRQVVFLAILSRDKKK